MTVSFYCRWLARSVSRDLDRPLQSIYRTIILVLIESGLVITIAKLNEFVLFKLAPGNSGLSGLNALYIVFEMIPQINVRYLFLLLFNK